MKYLVVAAFLLGLATTTKGDHTNYVYPANGSGSGGGRARSMNPVGDNYAGINRVLDNAVGTRLLSSETRGHTFSRDQVAATDSNSNIGETGKVTAKKQAIVKGPAIPVGVDEEDEEDDEDDEDDAPNGNAFGLEGLTTLLSGLRPYEWKWPVLLQRPPVTDPTTAGFTDVECTGRYVDLADVRRAAKHLQHFCNRYGVNAGGLYASTADTSTIYMCSYKGQRVCSIGLWNEANEHLDRECGYGATGYVHLNGLRIGREVAHGWTICERLNHYELQSFSLRQKDARVEGLPYPMWVARHKIQAAMDATSPKTVNEKGNDEDP